jgi:biopolymer transport protein ExbD
MVVIQIKADGSVLLDHQVMSEDALKQKLSETVKQNKDCAVLIDASEKASAESITKVMDQCRKQGIGKFSMQTNQTAK